MVYKVLKYAGMSYEWFLHRVCRYDYNRILYNLIGKSFYEVSFYWTWNNDVQRTVILADDEFHMARFLRREFGPIEFLSVKNVGTVDSITMGELDELLEKGS